MKVLNTYTAPFSATCPANGASIGYTFRLETWRMVRVETIHAELDKIRSGFHEDIANDLYARLGGRQTITAEHHGVHIETVRW